MGKSSDDKLFHFFKDGQSLHGRKFSYFAWESSYIHSFSIYIDGYINAAAMIIEEYKKATENAVLDSVVYPLCFIYRHIIELYIKYFYFKFTNEDDDEKMDFIRKENHGLQSAWSKTKLHILPLYTKIECNVDLEIIDNYVKQMDDFDSTSIRMRYPIKKDLSRTHQNHARLDVLSLHDKIMQIVNMFQQLEYRLDRVIADNTTDNEFVEKITNLYRESRNGIIEIIKTLNDLSTQKAKHRTNNEVSLGSIDLALCMRKKSTGDNKKLYEMIMELPGKHACLLGILSHAGLDILYGDPLLSDKLDEKKKDFIKYLETVLVLGSSYLSFDDKFSNREMCNALLDKEPGLMYKALKTAFDLMEICLDETH